MRSPKHGFTLIELLVVIAIIAILASILFPVFAKAREKARQATCTSQIRQIATAIQMYNQDNNGQYPGIDGGSWVGKLSTYLGNSDKMFACPSDTTKDSQAVSYALSGLLIRLNGQGVKESNVTSPSEVGALCDASPTETMPNGRLLIGGGNLDETAVAATPEPRHSKGVIAGYCDGHAKYFQGLVNPRDLSNGIARAFYQASPLGLIDNPLGGLTGQVAAIPAGATVAVGGEYAAYPLVSAAAQFYGSSFSRGFNGYNSINGRGSNYCWGYTTFDNGQGAGATGVAFDALVVIVAKTSKIPGLGSLVNGTYVPAVTATIANALSAGYVANTVQAYWLPATSLSCGQIRNVLGATRGADSIEVANDSEMVDKVANDPYGIGFCSSVFADPDRVTVLGIENGANDYIWPRASSKFRWVLPATAAEAVWPWIRRVDVASNGIEGNRLNDALHGALAAALRNGPLFQGYWPCRQ